MDRPNDETLNFKIGKNFTPKIFTANCISVMLQFCDKDICT